jgi:23S rRNA (adenine2503-C2)-methyltransferase
MTNLSQEVKKILSENISIGLLEIVEVKKDPDGTVKMLYKLEDGNVIEMAIINFEFG